MEIALTITQQQRLTELSAPKSELAAVFQDVQKRDVFFREREHFYIKQNRRILNDLLDNRHISRFLEAENTLTERLAYLGFTRVITPSIITKDMLSRMSLDDKHPLQKQVFWLDSKRCLRPMHAPNLYIVMGKLRKTQHKPVRIFECGPCFRKESQGSLHLNEFTMLNLVELGGVKDGEQEERLKELAGDMMEAAGIAEYDFVAVHSEVYGESFDILVNGEEVASCASGPHPLDDNWRITDPWVGIGIGIERLTMVKLGYENIRRVGRSLQYLDGANLNL